jgi:hypothetical protein
MPVVNLDRRLLLGQSLGLWLASLTPAVSAPAKAGPRRSGVTVDSDGQVRLTAYHLFDGPNGVSKMELKEFAPIPQTHLEGVALAAGERTFANLFESKALEINVTAAPPGYFIDWHWAKRRHFFVIVQGAWETGLGDGSLHRTGVGDFLLAEDRVGRGHTSRVVSDTWAVQMDVILSD